jgi:hypothetical protein
MKPSAVDRFDEAAKLLAKDKTPPEWLVPILAHHSRLVGYREKITKEDETEERRMLACAKYLETWLPMYLRMEEEFGFPIPDCIETVLSELPELIEYLENQLLRKRKGGPTPDSSARHCAAVCAEVWRRQRGEVQPYSPKLWAACEKYWQACGNPEKAGSKGRLKNWEQYLVDVNDADDEGFREYFGHQITQLK